MNFLTKSHSYETCEKWVKNGRKRAILGLKWPILGCFE